MIDDINKYIEIKNIITDIYLRMEIKTLPISVMNICRTMNIVTIPYREAWQNIVDLGIEHECIERRAFALKFIEDNRWFIFYDCQTLPRVAIKYNLAYELAHIVLEHEMDINIKTRQAIFSRQQPDALYPDIYGIESRTFAFLLLIPFRIIQALNIYQTPDIKYLCGIALDTYYEKISHMENLAYTDVVIRERDQQILNQFSKFIENYHSEKY